MALFKPFRGTRASLPQELHDGYAYFCVDDGTFHIDYTDSGGNLQRKQINAKDAEMLSGMTLDAIKAYVQIQSDWNQNDNAQPDFVKNRTHWVEQETNAFMPATTETSNIEIPTLFYNYTFMVIVDGVQYICEPYSNNYGDLCLGDSRLTSENDMTNPIDVPFGIISSAEQSLNGLEEYYAASIYYPDDEVHTTEIRVLTGNVIYHKLNEAYIPDTIARKEDIDALGIEDYKVKEVTSGHDALTVSTDENGIVTIDFASEIILSGGTATIA